MVNVQVKGHVMGQLEHVYAMKDLTEIIVKVSFVKDSQFTF